MITALKKTLPVVAFIMLVTVNVALQPSQVANLFGGLAMALIIALLFFAAIRWDDVHKEAEREKRQLADVVGHARDAIVICDRNGSVLYTNDAARTTYAIAPDKDLGEFSFTTLGLSSEQWEDIVECVSDGTAWDDEISIGTASILVHMFRIDRYQGHQCAIVSVGRDLTEHKRLERELMHSQKLAAVGELAAGVAHEINNPMASIHSQIGLAQDLMGLTADPAGHEPVVRCIEEARRQVDRVSQIVNSLLRFSRRQEHELGPISLNDAIEQAVTFARSLPKLSGMTLETEPTELMACSDTEAVVQVLTNLIINASDACDGSGIVRLSVHQTDDHHAAIEVIDDGCGIDTAVLDRVFEPFFTTKSPDQGTGLGLSISYGIARSLGGVLELNARPQGGTVATLILPAAEAVPVTT